jgi:hypothetical protein
MSGLLSFSGRALRGWGSTASAGLPFAGRPVAATVALEPPDRVVRSGSWQGAEVNRDYVGFATASRPRPAGSSDGSGVGIACDAVTPPQ